MKIKENSGVTLQGIATVVMWLGVLLSVLSAAAIIISWGASGALLGILIGAVGVVLSWLSTRVLQGFGELVQYTAETATYLEILASKQLGTAAPVSSGAGAVGAGDSDFQTVHSPFTTAKGDDFQVDTGVLTKYLGNGGYVDIPAGVTTIGSYAFSRCAQLTGVNIPAGVKVIKDGAFFRCTGLTEVTLPMGVVSIALMAFGECTNLKKIVIPSSVTSIQSFAFKDSPNVTIYGARGSAAEHYAKANNILFIAE